MQEEKTRKRRPPIRYFAAAAAVLLIAAAAMGASLLRSRSGPLSQEALAEWEQRLNSPEWRGLVSQLYSDRAYLSASRLLESGGPVREPTAEEMAALRALGGEPEDGSPCLAVSEDALDDYLAEKTGQGLDAFRHTLSDWTYLPDSGAYCRAAAPAEEGAPLTVTGGEQEGDTLVLFLRREGAPQALGDTVLTLAGGRVQSHTNEQYNAVEAMALDLLSRQVRTLEDGGTAVQSAYLASLRCVDWREDGYFLWALDYRILPAAGGAAQAGAAVSRDGWLTADSGQGLPLFIVKRDADGRFVLMDTLSSGAMPVEDWNQYVDYALELGLTVDFGRPWPEATASLLRSVASGGEQWATTLEGVLTGYLLSCGDTLEGWETLSSSVGPAAGGQTATYVVASAREDTGLRRYTLLCRRSRYTDTQDVRPISLWQVVGVRTEGEAPAAPRSAAAGRSQTMELTAGETAIPCYLAQGGGSYGRYAWSLYLPQTWRQDGSRWYPSASQLSAFLEIRSHERGYTLQQFYDSFARYAGVETYLLWEGTAAWARGHSGRQQMTESLLFQGEDGVFEVMWTYPEGYEDRGLFAAAAETFLPGGAAGRLPFSQEEDGAPAAVLAEREPAVPEELWLVLPGGGAWRAADLFAPYLQALSGEAAFTGCSVLAALSAGQGRELVLLFGQFPVPLEEGEAIPTGAYASDSGRWMKDVPLWLAVEHDGERILSLRALSAPRAVPPSVPLLQSLLDAPADPFSAPPGGWRDAETGRVREAEDSPAP